MDISKRNLIKGKIIREFLDILFYRFHLTLIGETCGAILYIVILWKIVNHSLLLTWLGLILLINGLMRHFMTYMYYKRVDRTSNVLVWYTRFLATTFVSGCVWALGATFVLLIQNNIYRLIIVLFMYAVIGVSNLSFLPDKKLNIAFIGPIYTTLIVCLLSINKLIFNILSFALLLQLILSINLTSRVSKEIMRSVILRFKNIEILNKLMLSKHKIEDANNELTSQNEAIYKAEVTLHHLATHDQLTELPNRILLNTRLLQALERAKREHTRVAILIVDLDYFKQVNDTLGHAVGDKLLVETAKRMKKIVRENDIIARLGGDEFCIALVDIESVSIISTIAKKIVKALSQPLIINSHHIAPSASVGISVYPDTSNDIPSLLRNADLALYRAKEKGRDMFVFN